MSLLYIYIYDSTPTLRNENPPQFTSCLFLCISTSKYNCSVIIIITMITIVMIIIIIGTKVIVLVLVLVLVTVMCASSLGPPPPGASPRPRAFVGAPPQTSCLFVVCYRILYIDVELALSIIIYYIILFCYNYFFIFCLGVPPRIVPGPARAARPPRLRAPTPGRAIIVTTISY